MSEPTPEPIKLSVVVVTHDSADEVSRSLPAIAAELRPADQLIVCDNASSDGTPERVSALDADVELFELDSNLGFGAACNVGARAAANDLLLFLNPDAVVAPGFRDAIELPLAENRDWDAWQALLTADGGSVVNSWGGVVHFTGIAWAGGAGRPLAGAPDRPVGVSFASGACLAVRRAAWEALGGFSDEYFLYHEDTDLGLRLWLGGRCVGLEPRARCEHQYEFEKGPHKWYFLERNRYATIIRTFPTRLLLALLPGLIATEAALLIVATRGGWLGPKLRAYRDTARALPRLVRERRAVAAAAPTGGAGVPVSASQFADRLTPDLDSDYVGAASNSTLLRAMLRGYWRLVRLLIG